MNPIYFGLAMAVLGAIISVLSKVLKNKRGGSEKYQNILNDFYSSVNRELAPGETVAAYCGYNPCAAVTNRRLFVGDKKGVRSVSLSQIKKIRGTNFSGNKTDKPDQMLALEIFADKKYVVGNHSEGFSQVVILLQQYLAARS